MAIRLPTQRNVVGAVDPSIARDPGLTVSPVAFGSATGQGLTKVGEAGSDVAESIYKRQKAAQDKEQKRQDQIEAARVWSEIQEQDQEDFAKTTATEDIGNRQVYEALNERRIQRRQDALKNFTGSPDGVATLTEDLIDLNSRNLGQALSAHTEAAIARNESVVNKQASPLIFQAHKNPASIKQVLADLDAVARRNAEVFDAISEDDLRAELHQRAAIAAIEGDLSRGRLEPAQTSLDAFVQQGLVDDVVALNAQRRIDQIRFAYDEAALKGQKAPDLVAVPDPNSATGFSYIAKTLGGPAPNPKEIGVSDESTFRGQFNQLSKNFLEGKQAFGRIRASVASPSPAGDTALIVNYAKLLDPGSVVRPEEAAQVAAQGSLGDRAIAWGRRLLTGESLTDEMRKDIAATAQELYNDQAQQQQALREAYGVIAQQSGFSPEKVVPDYVGADEPIRVGKSKTEGEPVTERIEKEIGKVTEQLAPAQKAEPEPTKLSDGTKLPSLDEAQKMNKEQADALVGGLTDAQLKELGRVAPQLLDQLIAILTAAE